MRAYECVVSPDARAALLEALLETTSRVKIERKRDTDQISSESWSIAGMRSGWLSMSGEGDSGAWRVMFGAGRIGRIALEVFEVRADCVWIWPEGGPVRPVGSNLASRTKQIHKTPR